MAVNVEQVSVGPRQTLTQNVVYALPARAVVIHGDAALQVSNDSAFGASQAIVANTPTTVSGGYVRCTASNAVVYAKPL